MNGVLNINKPPALTSHDVVLAVRRLTQESRIGHLGTLDPMATGVLPLALGIATRLIEFSAYDKEYLATCLLGRTTDSCDVTGKVESETPTLELTEERVKEGVLKLREITQQIPPMVSAVKSGGKRLYELARQGLVVERQARPVRILKVEILTLAIPRVTFRVTCSAGTYVRVLCQTLGEDLGVGGCLESLERTRVGPFPIEKTTNPENLKKKMEEGRLSDILFPSSALVQHLPEIRLEGRMLDDLCKGKKMNMPALASGFYRVLNPKGQLSVIGDVSSEGELRPKKVFGSEGIL
jgi:tRNA pseudouridine55 synthase